MVDSFFANTSGLNHPHVSAASTAASEPETNSLKLSFNPSLDLRESLELLIGAEEEHMLPTDERLVRRERRFDLLVWLLNLEPRLGPYGHEPI